MPANIDTVIRLKVCSFFWIVQFVHQNFSGNCLRCYISFSVFRFDLDGTSNNYWSLVMHDVKCVIHWSHQIPVFGIH